MEKRLSDFRAREAVENRHVLVVVEDLDGQLRVAAGGQDPREDSRGRNQEEEHEGEEPLSHDLSPG
jgi:hypothetical protein